MALKYPANFVSYHADFEDRGVALAQLEEVGRALATAHNVSSINDLKVRQTTLEWQVILEAADEAFQQRRYEEALAGYRTVSKKILELIEPKILGVEGIKVWPQGAKITAALIEASAGLLNHMIPLEEPIAIVHVGRKVVDPASLGATLAPSVVIAKAAAPQVVELTDSAAGAALQGRWGEAARIYAKALRAVPQEQAQLRAEVLLNLGAVEVQQNRSEVAIRHLTQARKLFDQAGDGLGTAQALHNVGLAHLIAGQAEKAVKSLDEARKVAGQASLRGLLEGKGNDGTGRLETPTAGAAPANTLSFPLARELKVARATGELVRAFARPPVSPGRVRALPPLNIDSERLADTLGSHDLSLKVRSVSGNVSLPDLKLETTAQQRHEEFGRGLSLMVGEKPVTLTWSKQDRLTSATLKEQVYGIRRQAVHLEQVGFKAVTDAETVINLPHLYHLVLPIKMGDCHSRLGEYEAAQEQYQRAASYELINLKLEAPDLWRRIGENVVAWGDSLYRDGETEEALPIYQLLMTEDGRASSSFLYTQVSLKPTGDQVAAWLDAVADDAALPDLNPAIAVVLNMVRKRWTYIAAGLDFYGNLATVVPPFSFRYLQEVARYFAQRAIQAEQRYIDFWTRFERGEMTRKELESAYELSLLGADAARHQEAAAAAAASAVAAAVNLANVRHQNAQNLLNQFNSVAWELESLAGHIARGNAWTGGDLPNLHYSASGRYDFDGKKHEVLQQLTKRQTRISNDLQRTRMQNSVAELDAARAVADAQADIAAARLEAAKIETQIAEQRANHAREMRDAFNEQKFNPEQWLFMAVTMKWLADTALGRAVEVARLMERVYNFENFDDREVIRTSYKLAWTEGLLGGEVLLSDIDSFTHYHVTRVKQKPIPVKWGISLAEEYPGQYLQLVRTGRMEFDIDLERVALSHPGTFRHQLAGVELEVDGFLPPLGLHGRLTNSGLGRYRDGEGQVHLRVQPAETLVLSRYSRRQDAIILTPPQEMRDLFEGNSVGSGWTLELPKISNDVDLNLVFDIRLVLYFECVFDHDLFVQDTEPPADVTFERTRALHLRHHFPDAYYQLRESGRATLEVAAEDFPYNQADPVLLSLAIAVTPTPNESVAGTNLSVQYPSQGAPVNVTVSDQHVVPKADLPIVGEPSALGVYEIEIEAQLERKDQIADLILVLDYRYTPAQ